MQKCRTGSKSGTVRAKSNYKVEYYSHVMHIDLWVEGEIQPGFDTVGAMIARFLAGTVSSAPNIRAMQIIDEVEPDRRGVYFGAIGYVSVASDVDTCIALRTAQVCDGQLHIRQAQALYMTVTRRPNSRKHRTRPWP